MTTMTSTPALYRTIRSQIVNVGDLVTYDARVWSITGWRQSASGGAVLLKNEQGHTAQVPAESCGLEWLVPTFQAPIIESYYPDRPVPSGMGASLTNAQRD